MKYLFKLLYRLRYFLYNSLQRYYALECSYLFKHKIEFGEKVVYSTFPKIHWDDTATYISIGNHTCFRGTTYIRTYQSGTVSIGKNCFFNEGVSITALEKIEIGNGCILGESIKLYDHNHLIEGVDTVSLKKFTTSPIRIGEDCWIGSNVILLKGVQIGKGCIIGAGTILRQSIPEYTIVYIDGEGKIVLKNRG